MKTILMLLTVGVLSVLVFAMRVFNYVVEVVERRSGA